MTNLARLSLLVLAACGTVDRPPGGDDDPGVDSGIDDPGTLSVVSVSPDDGETGVAATATITVTFDTPMDQPTVEAAWQSADLPPAAVAFSWDAAGTTLTVTPNDRLELASGTGIDPSVVTARAYAFAIGTTAKGLDGRELDQQLSVSFTTLRRLDVELSDVQDLTRTIRADGLAFGETAVTLVVGDSSGNLQTKIFTTFTLPRLPVGSTVDLAVLRGNQNSVAGVPYGFGALRAVHTSNAVIDDTAFGATPLAVIGDFSTDTTAGAKALNVTAQVIDDLANSVARGNRTQYRLEFATAANANGLADEARFSRSGFGLSLAYVIP
jgi:hypothetical protein